MGDPRSKRNNYFCHISVSHPQSILRIVCLPYGVYSRGYSVGLEVSSYLIQKGHVHSCEVIHTRVPGDHSWNLLVFNRVFHVIVCQVETLVYWLRRRTGSSGSRVSPRTLTDLEWFMNGWTKLIVRLRASTTNYLNSTLKGICRPGQSHCGFTTDTKQLRRTVTSRGLPVLQARLFCRLSGLPPPPSSSWNDSY